MGSEGFFFTDTVDAIVDVLPLGTLNEEQERKLREAVGLLAARDFTLETYLANVLSGQANSEIITTATAGTTVTFPSAFRNPPFVLVGLGDSADGLIPHPIKSTITETTFDVRVWDTVAGAASNGVPVEIVWIAVG